MKLWLDDVRPAPKGWAWAKSVEQAMELLTSGEIVTHASLDHDLGIWASDGGDGAKLTDWMAWQELWPTEGIRIHSSNPMGVQVMLATADRYGPYAQGYGTARGSAPESGWPEALYVRPPGE